MSEPDGEALSASAQLEVARLAGFPIVEAADAERIAAGAWAAVRAVRAARSESLFDAEPADYLRALDDLAGDGLAGTPAPASAGPATHPSATTTSATPASADGWLDGTLLQAAAALARGEVSSEALTAAALRRAAAAQDRLHCFVSIEPEAALAEARASDERRGRGLARGALDGIPVAHKDMFARGGLPVSCGSRVTEGYRPATTATVVQRMAALGAVQIGTLNLAEFALGPTGHNYALGHCRNAVDPRYIAGGSSSGSGASVGARVVFASLGSDTGGSVRLPAAMNGVVGFKPTHGRVSRHGAMKLSPTLDVLGPLTRSVADCALVLGAIAGPDPSDPTSAQRSVPDWGPAVQRDVRGLRVGWPRNYFHDELHPDVRQRVEASLAALESEGARLVPVTVPDPAPLAELSRAIVYSEAAAQHGAWLRERAARYGPQVRVRASTGLGIPAPVYLEAMMLRARIMERFVREVFACCDTFLTATLPIPVPRLDECDVGSGPGLWTLLSRLVHCTAPINYLGLPAIAVPTGCTSNGLPASVQLVGRPFAEDTLIAAAAAHERALR